jgi:hypothetical protein
MKGLTSHHFTVTALPDTSGDSVQVVFARWLTVFQALLQVSTIVHIWGAEHCQSD